MKRISFVARWAGLAVAAVAAVRLGSPRLRRLREALKEFLRRERRSGADRRADSDRRSASDRRSRADGPPDAIERRSGSDRRSGTERRSGLDRRATGIRLSDPALLSDLLDFLQGRDYAARQAESDLIEVRLPRTLEKGRAKEELRLHLADWQLAHPGVQATLLS